MPPNVFVLRFTASSRLPAALAVLLLHLVLGSLLVQQQVLKRSEPPRSELRWIELPALPPPADKPADKSTPRTPPTARALPELARPPSPLAITLPAVQPSDFPSALPAKTENSTAAAPAPPASAPPRALNLNLPTAVARRNTPLTPAELANLDSRANSPRESAEERMANAMGAKGWTVIEGVQGGTMMRGPHGECLLSRPSMLNEIPGHPHAGMVPNKVSGCSELQKGARVHKRPGS